MANATTTITDAVTATAALGRPLARDFHSGSEGDFLPRGGFHEDGGGGGGGAMNKRDYQPPRPEYAQHNEENNLQYAGNGVLGEQDEIPTTTTTPGRKKVPMTPLPKLKMLAVAATLLTEAMCSTMLLPFVGLFVAQLKGISVEEAGYSSGVLVGLFMMGQIISTRLWGWMSDVYGRRPPLLMGLFAGGLTMFFFGMSPNIYVCCILRFIHGFFNGNILIAKVIIADITDDTNAATGFSSIAILWSCGAVVGPIIGGFLYDPLVNPMLQWLDVQEGSFLANHPAFLASLIISLYTLFNCALCFFVLSETNKNRTGSLRTLPVVGWVLNYIQPKNVIIVNMDRGGGGGDGGENQTSEDGQKKENLQDEDEVGSRSRSTKAGELAPVVKQKPKMTYKKAFSDRVLRSIMLVTMCMGFADMAFVEVIPLWLIATTEVGGLGLFSDKVGILLLFCSISAVIFNFFFPKIVRKVNNYKMIWICSLILFALSIVFTPVAPGFGPRVGLWFVWLTGSLKNCSCAAGFTCSQVLVGQAAPPGTLGEVYGIAQTFGVLVRCVVPFIIAPLLAWSLSPGRAFPFNYFFTFWVSALPLALGSWLCWRNPIERTKEDMMHMISLQMPVEEQQQPQQEARGPGGKGREIRCGTRVELGILEGKGGREWGAREKKTKGDASYASRSILLPQGGRPATSWSRHGTTAVTAAAAAGEWGGSTRGKYFTSNPHRGEEDEEDLQRHESLVAHVSFLGLDGEEEENAIQMGAEAGAGVEEGDPAITMEEYRSMANSFASCISNNFLSRMVTMEESREEELRRWRQCTVPKWLNPHLDAADHQLEAEDFRLAGEDEEEMTEVRS